MRFSRRPAYGTVSLVHTLLEKDINQREEELDVPFIASRLFIPDLSLTPTVPGYNKLQMPKTEKNILLSQAS